MSELLIDPFNFHRASYEFRDEIFRAGGKGSLEDAVQGLREVAATMGGRDEHDGRDGIGYVLEHRVILA